MTPHAKKRWLLAGSLFAVALCLVIAFVCGIVGKRPGHSEIATPAGREQGAHGSDKGQRDLEPLHSSESVTRQVENVAGQHNDVNAPITDLSVQVFWEGGGAAAGIGVGIRNVEDAEWAFKRATTDATGIAKFQPSPGSIVVIVDRSSSQRTQVAEGESKILKITIPSGNDVKGTVVTRDGDPVGGARILLYDPESAISPCVVANSNSGGEFVIRSVRLGMTEVCAEAPSFSPSPRVRLKSHSPGYTHTVQLVVGAPGGSLAVRVTSRDGNPVAGALVTVGDWPPDDDAVVQPDGSELAPYLPRAVLTDKDGKALAENLASGPQAIRVQSVGFGYCTQEVNVPLSNQPANCEIVLDPEAAVRGTVRNSKGGPIADVMVYRKMPNHFPSKTLLTRSKADGTFELKGLPSGNSLLFARKGGVNVSTDVNLAAGQVLSWDPKLDLGLSLAGHLSVPVACSQQFRIECSGENGGNVQTEYLDGSGDFAFYGLGSEPQVIEVIARLGFGTCYQHVVNPGDAPLKIELDCSLVPSIRIQGRLVWDKGNVADLRVVPIGPGYENSSLYNRTRPDGSFDIGKYRPGGWKIEVRKGDFNVTLLQTKVIEIAANETVDLGTLVIPETK